MRTTQAVRVGRARLYVISRSIRNAGTRAAAIPGAAAERRSAAACACCGAFHSSPGFAAGTTRSDAPSSVCCIHSRRPSSFEAAFSSPDSGRSCCSASRARPMTSISAWFEASAWNDVHRVPAGRPIASASARSLHRDDGLHRPARRIERPPEERGERVLSPDAALAGDVPHGLARERVERHHAPVVLDGHAAQRLDVRRRRHGLRRGGRGGERGGEREERYRRRRAAHRPGGPPPVGDARAEDDEHPEHEAVVAEEHDRLAGVLRHRQDREVALRRLAVAALEELVPGVLPAGGSSR